ncbi:phosphoserine phosphatase 1 [Deinococcus xinjiangensis]|uniref:Phosphoserine phosphatase 1 n=1 Tax=Deinococcus xinjiangensis TaxID=457454 RepID=A0ABP9VC31_9DEIO
MDIYLVRHGQTEWNVSGRSQGRLDSPLTPLGVQQAEAHARTLANIPFARAYSSPMGRAVRTAQIILAGHNVPLTVLDDLAELDHGELGGLLPEERSALFPELREQRQRDKYNTVLPGGESYATAAPRARRALEQIGAAGPGPVLIVSHEMIGRLLRLHLLGLTPEQAMQTSHPQDTIYRVLDDQLWSSAGGSEFLPH